MIDDATRPAALVPRVVDRVEEPAASGQSGSSLLQGNSKKELRPPRAAYFFETFSPNLRRWAAVAISAPAGLGASPSKDAKRLRSTMSLAMVLLQMLIQDTQRFERTTRAALMRATERPRCPNPVRNFHMPRPCVLRGELCRAPRMRADIRQLRDRVICRQMFQHTRSLIL